MFDSDNTLCHGWCCDSFAWCLWSWPAFSIWINWISIIFEVIHNHLVWSIWSSWCLVVLICFKEFFIILNNRLFICIYSFAIDDPKTFYTRLAVLMGFGFLTGNSIGPLLDLVISIEPQVVVTALIGTAVVFVSLSCSALLAERGSFLFLGGIFMSILSTMTLFGLANIFIQSQILYQVLYSIHYTFSEHFFTQLNRLY